MINVVKIISTAKDKANVLIAKFLRYGRDDVQTSKQISPFGVDSNPIKDMVAIYSQTGDKGETFIVGYVNKNSLAATGETRLFSTNDNGVVQVNLHLKKNGTIEIGGTANNLVKFNPLDSSLTAYNNLLKAELIKIQAALAAVGGAYAYVPPTIDITSSKVENLKCQ